METSYEYMEGVLTPFGSVGFSHSVWRLKPGSEKGVETPSSDSPAIAAPRLKPWPMNSTAIHTDTFVAL